MKIYKDEKFIEDRIVANKTAAMLLPINTTEDKSDLLIQSLEKIRDGKENEFSKATSIWNKSLAQIVNENHPDLMYGSAILVSTVMNKNDDVFLPDETWAARNTAVNQPYNDQHVEIDIIGHIIAARPLDEQGNAIGGDEPPGYFDIEVDFVIYKSIFPAIAKDIYDNAPMGKKFVSMECRFKDFDYALVDQDTKAVKIIQRNEETAFLTKYLRAYGGEGIYRNYKIGRVLRQLRFSGMGNVDMPANPASEYTKIENFGLAASVNESNSKVILHVTKGQIMKIETLEQAVAEIERLTSEKADLEKKISAAEVDERVSALENEKKKLADELEAEKTKVSVAETNLTDINKTKENLEKELNDVKAELQTKTSALEKIEKETKANERFGKLKELGFEVTEEKREKIANLSEEAYASVVEFAELHKAKASETAEKTEDAKEGKEDEADKNLENVQEDVGANLENTAGDSANTAEQIHQTAAKLIEKVRLNTRKVESKSKKKD